MNDDVALVDRFFARLMELRPVEATSHGLHEHDRRWPDGTLAGAEERLTLFLIQYWGGPSTYSDQRGHPRLRMRHAPFRIDAQARDQWLHHMAEAVRALKLDAADETELWQYLQRAAHFMVNVM